MRVAVVGATGVFGRELVAALEDLGEAELGEPPILLATDRGAGEVFPWRGEEELLVEPFSAENVRGVEVALLAVPAAASPTVTDTLRKLGITTIDASRVHRASAPLFLAEASTSLLGAPVVALPSADALQLARVLRPLQDLEPAWVRATVLRAASGAGHVGVEELAEATARLLNGQEPPEPSLRHRLAFNVIPQVGAFADGVTEAESDLAAEIGRLVGDVRLAATAAWAPWFYGHFQSLTIGFARTVSPEAIRSRLSGAAAVKLVDEPEGAVYPMPSLAVGDEAVLVGRVRADPVEGRAIQLTCAMDNLRASAVHALEALRTVARARRAH